eukprot:TRINITY_DN13152_c0_g1_i1.p2 TRINITY_DN13152_c0_g1~~TRINITY_DN13152_c0_g1_i1.p2  ORF type:complete len:212 (+),score=35.99 TRINITY_DN13152_c0_g1_i1:61-636(+)
MCIRDSNAEYMGSNLQTKTLTEALLGYISCIEEEKGGGSATVEGKKPQNTIISCESIVKLVYALSILCSLCQLKFSNAILIFTSGLAIALVLPSPDSGITILNYNSAVYNLREYLAAFWCVVYIPAFTIYVMRFLPARLFCYCLWAFPVMIVLISGFRGLREKMKLKYNQIIDSLRICECWLHAFCIKRLY